MQSIAMPIERLLFGNENWRTFRAIDEIEIYCGLVDDLQDRIDTLETRGKDEEASLSNVQAVLSSYAFEIAMKSLWALDNPTQAVPRQHDIVAIFEGFKVETVRSLERLQLSREVLEDWPKPFVSNRYSMENGSRDIAVYKTSFLRALVQLLSCKIEETRMELHRGPQA